MGCKEGAEETLSGRITGFNRNIMGCKDKERIMQDLSDQTEI